MFVYVCALNRPRLFPPTLFKMYIVYVYKQSANELKDLCKCSCIYIGIVLNIWFTNLNMLNYSRDDFPI